MEEGVPETKLELEVERNTVDRKCILKSAKLGGKNFAEPIRPPRGARCLHLKWGGAQLGNYRL